MTPNRLAFPPASALVPRTLLAVACGLAVTTPASRAWAQAGPDDASGTVYLSPLVTDADEADPYAEPAPESTIGRDAIDLFGGQNLDDALRSTAGTFTRDNPQNAGVAVNIRGMEGSGRVNMMIDGVRQSFRFTGHEAQGFTYVDTALLGGVDIRRGASGGAAGTGALAGSANFRTLDVDDVLARDDDAGGFLSLSLGDNGSRLSGVTAAAVRAGDWSAVGAISARSPDAYQNGNGEVVPDTGQDLRSGLAKLDYRGAVHRFGGGVMVYDNDFLANSYDQNIRSEQVTTRYGYAPGSDLVDLSVNAYRSMVRMRYGSAPSIPTGGTARGRVIEDTGFGFDASNAMRFGEHVESVVGVSWFRDDVDVVNSTAVPGRGVNPSGESSIASVFSDTTLRWGIADIIAGLRYDRFTIDGSGSVTASNPLGMPAGPYEVDRSEGRFNPSLTLALNVTDWLQPYLRGSKTFRPPTISETLAGGDHPADGGPPQSFFPNPFLKPETSRGLELGANIGKDGLFTPDDRLRAKLTVYREAIDDYVTAMFGPSGTFFGNNAGTSDVRGVEIEGGYDAGFVFANLAWTRTDSDLPSQVNGLGAQSYVPEHVTSATLGTRLLEQRLTLGLRWFDVSRSFIGDINAYDGNPWEPGYHLLDVFANYVLANGIEVRANVSNVLDEAYTPALSTPAGGNAIDTGRGRAWMVTLKLPF